MKREFYAFSPLGVACVFFSGIFLGQATLPCLALAVLLVIAAREDLVQQFVEGSYQRKWFLWRRIGDVSTNSAGNNVVPFKGGPAA